MIPKILLGQIFCSSEYYLTFILRNIYPWLQRKKENTNALFVKKVSYLKGDLKIISTLTQEKSPIIVKFVGTLVETIVITYLI